MGDFKKLQAWRKAHALALNVHRVASRMRGPGTAMLRNQMMRAAFSIPTNIVEGHGQASPRNFARFLGYALNSGAELEQHLLTTRDIHAISQSDFLSILSAVVEVRKMIHGLRASIVRPRANQQRSNFSATDSSADAKREDSDAIVPAPYAIASENGENE